MNEQLQYPRGTRVTIVEVEEKEKQLYRDYEQYVGKKGMVIGIGATMNNEQGLAPIFEKPLNLYEIDLDKEGTILIPEEMLKPDEM